MAPMTKQQLIEFIADRYSDNDYFDLTIELDPPPPDFSPVGCEFGSAEHMLRQPSYRHIKETIKLCATRVLKNSY